MDERYARVYGALARRHWWWAVRDAAVEDALDRWVPQPREGRVLDVGCGDGRLFPMLRRFGSSVEGIEPDDAARTTITPQGTIHAAPFAAPLPVAGPYALITMLDVLEHLDDRAAALRLCHALLAADGRLLVTVPALPWLWTSHDDLNHHRVRFTRATLVAVLEEAGFLPLAVRHLFHGLVPLKLAARAKERLVPARDPVPGVPPAPVNAALAATFRLETLLAGPVARWLPGSSLLAVARPR